MAIALTPLVRVIEDGEVAKSGSTPKIAAALVRKGQSILAPDMAFACNVLLELGLTEEQVTKRVDLAMGGEPIAKHYPGKHDQKSHGRRIGGGFWGGRHYGSTTMTGEAAKMMGLDGWRDNDDPEAARYARGMLQGIADAKPRNRPLFHGERMTPERLAEFRTGRVVGLPLTATSTYEDSAVSYGRPGTRSVRKPDDPRLWDAIDHDGKRWVIMEFAPGVRAYDYGAGEHITAGLFRVDEVSVSDKQSMFDYLLQEDVMIPVTRIRLTQVEVPVVGDR